MKNTYATSRLVITGDSPRVDYTISPSISFNRFYVESFVVPSVWDTLPAFEVNFIDAAFVPHTFSIPGGIYTISSVLTLIVNRMNLSATLGNPYTFSLNANKTWSITATVGTFELSISIPAVSQRLGLIDILASVLTVATSEKYNMSPTSINVQTNIPISTQSVSYTNLTSPAIDVSRNVKDGSSYTFICPTVNRTADGSSDPANVSIQTESYATQNAIMNGGINNIRIELTDELGVPIDTYPQRWTLVLLFYNY